MQSKKQCQMLDGTAFLGLREPKSGLARDLGDCLQSRNVPFGTSGDSSAKYRTSDFSLYFRSFQTLLKGKRIVLSI